MQPRRTGPFPYSPITQRARLAWPNEARVALWVIPNIEFFGLDEPVPRGAGVVPDVPAYATRDYGARVGIWRMMDSLSRHGIRATVALNSDVCDVYPQIMEEGVKLHWEFMGHNETNSRLLNTVPPEDERRVVHDTLKRIQHSTGVRPKGWLGSGLHETWNSLGYFLEEGLTYVADWVNDDQPYLMNVEGKRLVSVPYSLQINDIPAFERQNRTPEEFDQMIRRQFDVLYQEGAESGRVMAIALHPYLTGIPYRIRALDAALDYICAHEGVWLATGSEIADWYLAHPPA